MNDCSLDGPDETAEEEDEQTVKIRALNDEFRQTFMRGRMVMTEGVRSLPAKMISDALVAIQQFDDFNEGNDPWHLHDFGEVSVEGVRIWFKIDCYDKDMVYGSPDASDPDQTIRVMTILLPEEY